MITITKASGNKERILIKYLLLLLFIWLSWKGIIHILGEQSVPLDERMFPALSAVWERFNLMHVNFLTRTGELILHTMGYNAFGGERNLWIAGYPGVTVGNYCLGVQLMYYFVLIVVTAPMSGKKKTIGIAAGIAIAMMLNIIRITGLVLISYHIPQYLFLAHDHLFNIVVFGSLLTFLYFLVAYKGNAIPADL